METDDRRWDAEATDRVSVVPDSAMSYAAFRAARDRYFTDRRAETEIHRIRLSWRLSDAAGGYRWADGARRP